jgi:glucose/arabinose dehydrogenase
MAHDGKRIFRRAALIPWALGALLVGCGGGNDSTLQALPAPGPVPPGATRFVPTAGAVTTSPLATGLASPWSLAFLPDGRMLVTQKGGQLLLLTAQGARVGAISGLPAVAAVGQGGLLDVVIDPAFASNRRIYFSFSEADTGNPALNGTAVARAELDPSAPTLSNLSVIYRQTPKVASSGHFGSRLVFGNDGHLFVTLGDRQSDDQRVFAQDLTRGNGKVVRITTEGAPAPGNPFVSRAGGALPEIWTYGHRNPQGAALHPLTGELWTNEHGPQGGDEVNRHRAGGNHGWPVVSFGQEYGTSTQVGEGTAKAGMEPPLAVWETLDGSAWNSGAKSSTAPSGMAFFTGSQPAEWTGSVFVGALAGRSLWRLVFDGDREVGRERLLVGLGQRIRDVRQGPDGRLYLLTDDATNGQLLRVSVARP